MTPTDRIERLEIHNSGEIRGLPSGRRLVEAIRGRKWARVRVVGRRTFKRIPREALDRITLGSANLERSPQ